MPTRTLVLVLVALVAGGVLVRAALLRPAALHHRSVPRRSLDAIHARDVRYANEAIQDIAEEICSSFDLPTLARRYGVTADPAAVVAAFVAAYPRSLRAGARSGCARALLPRPTKAQPATSAVTKPTSTAGP